uniref:Uncharacterized protein n=1 Tax=Glossina austeni TaxID=7395 RepID=A0A1A9VDW8_GLOAU
MVQAGVAPYPGAPTGYPPTTAQVGAATDALSMAVVKADPVTAQMKADAAAVATNGATNTNVTSSAATTAAVAQLYMQQKKNNNLATNAHTLQFNGGNTNTANSILASTAGSNTVSSSTVTTGLGVNNPAVTAQATSACMEAFDPAALALLLIVSNVRSRIYDPVLRASDDLSPPTDLISFKGQVVRCNKQFTPIACNGDPKSAATQT